MTDIQGVIFQQRHCHTDSRGWLSELYRSDELPSKYHPEMAYLSMTLPGVIRGPHEHLLQTDHFIFLGLSQFTIYLWDHRKNSPTFNVMRIYRTEVGEIAELVVPPGVAHGYQNTGGANGLILNLPTELYRGLGRRGEVDEIRYEGTELGRQLDELTQL